MGVKSVLFRAYTVKYWAYTVKCWANKVGIAANTVVFGANFGQKPLCFGKIHLILYTVVFRENTVVLWRKYIFIRVKISHKWEHTVVLGATMVELGPNTVIFKAKTVVFVLRWSYFRKLCCFLLHQKSYLGKYSLILCQIQSYFVKLYLYLGPIPYYLEEMQLNL